jgi:hypothetical protein
MTITDRDKRALIGLGAAAVISLSVYFWPQESSVPEVVGSVNTAAEVEQRLQRVRGLAAQVPARQQELERLTAELGKWETGLIKTETGQQAQAEIVQVLRRIGSNQVPPLGFGSVEIGQLRPLGDSKVYGEALVSVSFDCSIEQLVNTLADMTAQEEIIVTEEIRITPRREEDKSLQVRLTVAGLVPRELVPQQRGMSAF